MECGYESKSRGELAVKVLVANGKAFPDMGQLIPRLGCLSCVYNDTEREGIGLVRICETRNTRSQDENQSGVKWQLFKKAVDLQQVTSEVDSIL